MGYTHKIQLNLYFMIKNLLDYWVTVFSYACTVITIINFFDFGTVSQKFITEMVKIKYFEYNFYNMRTVIIIIITRE